MTIEKKITVDLIEVVGNNVQVRTRTSMMEDGKEISASFHRHVVMPGECGIDEDDRVKAVCAGIHTPEVVAAYKAEQARIKAEQESAAAKAAEQAAIAEAEAKLAADEAMLKLQLEQQAAFDAAVADAVTRALMGGR